MGIFLGFFKGRGRAGPKRDCVDHLLTFTPRFSPPLFQKEFEEEDDVDTYEKKIAEPEIWMENTSQMETGRSG